VEWLKSEANFSEDQLHIFELLNRDSLLDDGIMLKLGMPEKRYYREKRAVIEKVKILLPILKRD
jgi:hypothetical protein